LRLGTCARQGHHLLGPSSPRTRPEPFTSWEHSCPASNLRTKIPDKTSSNTVEKQSKMRKTPRNPELLRVVESVLWRLNTAADEKIPLSVVRVNCKPQHLVFWSHTRRPLPNRGVCLWKTRKSPRPVWVWCSIHASCSKPDAASLALEARGSVAFSRSRPTAKSESPRCAAATRRGR
jgi:hypothetical protein